ncbi:hypothetical protein ACLMJK_004112 [Lecanora helva]
MQQAWIPGGYDPIIINGHQARPGQRRGRLASEHADHRSQMYYTDGDGYLVPATTGGVGRVRAASASERNRPSQIIINNEFENHSPQRSPQRDPRRRSRGREYYHEGYSDDDWDERAHSPRRHSHGHSHSHHRKPSRHRRSPSRSPSPYDPYDFEYEKMKAKVEDLERKEHAQEEEKRRRARWEEEQLIEEAKKAKKKKDEEAFKKKAIEEYHIKEAEEQLKKAEEKKKADEEYKKRARKDLEKAGLGEEEIERVLKGKELVHHGHGHGGHEAHAGALEMSRPTWVKVHRKNMSPETLDFYELPWEWDAHNTEYIIIKRWIPEHDQTILFEHTRKLRERKQLTDTTIELKKERDQLLLVRKKSPARRRSRSRSWVLT